MKKKYFILYPLILIQIVIIAYLLYHLSGKSSQLKVKTNASVPKENIIATSSALHYFYDLKPDTQQSWGNSRLKNITSTYSINHNAENDTRNYSTQKPSGTYRIISLGDSVTFGLYVAPSQNYSKVLEKSLNATACSGKHFEVINLGVPGYDPTYEVERYRIRGTHYNPDLIVWYLGDEDLNEVLEKMLPQIKDMSGKEEANARLHAIQQLKKDFSTKEILQYQKIAFDTLDVLFKGHLVFLTTNVLTQEHRTFLENYVNQRPNTSWYELKTDLYKEDAIITGDSHPNAKGHTLIASFLKDNLTHEKFFPCAQR